MKEWEQSLPFESKIFSGRKPEETHALYAWDFFNSPSKKFLLDYGRQ